MERDDDHRHRAVASQVRTAARNVNTNRKRVDSTTSARVFSERQLDAARKKFAVGLAQSIDVLIAQRDLANARFNELSAIIDYVQSLVEFETVQEGGTGGVYTKGPGSSHLAALASMGGCLCSLR